MELPNCLEDYEPDLSLTVYDRRELIVGLAKDGTKSIDDFIQKHTNDRRSGIAKLIQKLRRKLDAQIRRTREKIESKFTKQQKSVQEDFKELLEPVEYDESFKESTISDINQKIDTNLLEILSKDPTLNFIINFEEGYDEEKPSWWERLKIAFRCVVEYLKEMIRRFIAWLKAKFGRKDKSVKSPDKERKMTNILLSYPSGKNIWDQLDRKIDNALATSPEFKRTLARDFGIKGGKLVSKSQRQTSWASTSKDSYEPQVKQQVKQRIKRVIKQEQEKLENELLRKKRRIKQLRSDKKYQEKTKRDLESRLNQLEKQKSGELSQLERQYKKVIHDTVKDAMISELEDAGYVQKDKKNVINITSQLIDRFAEIVLSDELQKLPGKHSMKAGNLGNPHGIYEKHKLRMSAEISRMDIVDSMVNARLAHPKQHHIYDSDITTHTDVRSTVSHVVLVFDKSGSMEENQRIIAAKKAVLALYKAVKRKNPRNIVDFIAFDSTVQIMDILNAWQSSPGGFTNTSEALNTARILLKDSHADNKLIYLITDGLPEAYTDKDTDQPRAGDLDKSLKLTVSEAKKLRKLPGTKLTIILLEPKDEIYTDAASTIARAAGGSVIVTDPKTLATEMLTDYIEI